MRTHSNGWSYGVAETLLITAIIGGLFFTAWFVHRSSDTTKNTLSTTNKVAQSGLAKTSPAKVTSYAGCEKAPGSRTLTTFPAQCVTTGGKSFTETTVTKAAADSPMPAAGTCETSNGTVVTVTLSLSVPEPRCSQVTADQTLKVVNPTGQTVTATLGGQSVTIPAGKSGVIAMPFGDYLQTGDHVMQTGLYGGSGPEIYLPAS